MTEQEAKELVERLSGDGWEIFPKDMSEPLRYRVSNSGVVVELMEDGMYCAFLYLGTFAFYASNHADMVPFADPNFAVIACLNDWQEEIQQHQDLMAAIQKATGINLDNPYGLPPGTWEIYYSEWECAKYSTFHIVFRNKETREHAYRIMSEEFRFKGRYIYIPEAKDD